MDISEVSAEGKVFPIPAERDNNTEDHTAAGTVNSAKAGMGSEDAGAVEACGCLAPATCATSSCN